MDPEKTGVGRLYGVGVGPGDPELITLRGHRILSEVPVIFIPQKDERADSFAWSIIADMVDKSKVQGLIFPMSRDRKQLNEHWRKAAAIVWQHLDKGEDCAMVTLGDPLLYGTFIHLLETLRMEHPEVDVEVIPGVSSVTAAAARAVVPLAISDERVAIISGNDNDEAIRKTLESFDTIVFLKPNAMFDRLLGILGEMDLLDRCSYVSRCTTGDEEIVRDIRELKGKKLDYFSLLIVRK